MNNDTRTMAEILAEVASRRGLEVEDLRGLSRVAPIARARQEAMAEIYATGRYSTTQIGQRLNRDHTTVLHGLRRFRERGQS